MSAAAYSLGLYEKALPPGLEWPEMLGSARECGFDSFEISVDESDTRLERLYWPESRRAEVRAAAEQAGVPVATLCLSAHRKYPLGARDGQARARSLEILRRAVGLAGELGVRIIQLAGYDVYYEPGDALTRDYFEENLRCGVEIASAAGVCLGFETMENSFMDTVAKAMTFVSRVRSPYLGVYPDIGNLSNASERYHADLLSDLYVGEGHILAAHLKETRPGVYRNLAFGEGNTSYCACLNALCRMGVRRYTGEFWYRGEAEYRDTLRAASAFLRGHIAQAMEAAHGADGNETGQPLA